MRGDDGEDVCELCYSAGTMDATFLTPLLPDDLPISDRHERLRAALGADPALAGRVSCDDAGLITLTGPAGGTSARHSGTRRAPEGPARQVWLRLSHPPLRRLAKPARVEAHAALEHGHDIVDVTRRVHRVASNDHEVRHLPRRN